MNTGSVTVKNIESAFAGESMAHIKYRYFAKLCRAAGDEATARVFEETADQEVLHAFGHLDLLYPADAMSPARCLDMAIAGETYEYTEMYPSFRHAAEAEGHAAAVRRSTSRSRNTSSDCAMPSRVSRTSRRKTWA